jgi:hypothetical protein
VDSFMKVVRLEECCYPVACLVVDQDRTEQRLLGLDIMGRLAILRFGVVRVDRSKLRFGV